jgi:hypothetical protein
MGAAFLSMVLRSFGVVEVIEGVSPDVPSSDLTASEKEQARIQFWNRLFGNPKMRMLEICLRLALVLALLPPVHAQPAGPNHLILTWIAAIRRSEIGGNTYLMCARARDALWNLNQGAFHGADAQNVQLIRSYGRRCGAPADYGK